MNILKLQRRQCARLGALTLAFMLTACDGQSTPTTPAASSGAATPAAVADTPVTNGAEAWQKLLAGNQRFVAAKAAHPHQSDARRAEVAKGQKPFAIVLGCADSRVAPELIFDQGVGDLFVVRVAGNVLDNTILGSIEFAIEEFGAPLIVVLGHERCGAVKATLDALAAAKEKPKEEKAAPHSEIPSLVAAIKPAVEKAKGQPGDALDNGVKANVALVVEQLKKFGPIVAALKADKLKVVGARYDLEGGAVEVTVQ